MSVHCLKAVCLASKQGHWEKAYCEAVHLTQFMHHFHKGEAAKWHEHRKSLELEGIAQLSSLTS